MDPSEPAGMAEALDRLWTRFLPQLRERVAALESAPAALAEGRLSAEESAAAAAAAHKLAGVLGTFGMAGGTLLAREAELLYSGPAHAAAAARLASIAAELRKLIESRPA